MEAPRKVAGYESYQTRSKENLHALFQNFARMFLAVLSSLPLSGVSTAQEREGREKNPPASVDQQKPQLHYDALHRDIGNISAEELPQLLLDYGAFLEHEYEDEERGKYYRFTAASKLEKLGAKALPQLISLLRSPNPYARYQAAKLIGVLGEKGEPALPALIESTQKERSIGVLCIAQESFGRIGPKARNAVPLLIQGLKYEDKDIECLKNVRHSAAVGLAGIEEEAGSATPALLENLRFTHPDALTQQCVHLSSAYALMKVDKERQERIDALVRTFWKSDVFKENAQEHQRSIEELSAIGLAAVPRLARALREFEMPYRLEMTVQVLKNIGSDAVPFLMDMVAAEEDSKSRAWATSALERIGLEGKGADVLSGALRGLYGKMRRAAQDLQSPDKEFRDVLKKVLVGMGGTAVSPLLDLLEQEADNPELCKEVADVLIKVGDPSAVAMIDRLTQGHEPLARWGVYVLGEQKAEAALPILIQFLKSNTVQAETLRAIAKLASKAGGATPVLLELLRAPDGTVPKGLVVDALIAIGEEAVPLVATLLHEKDPDLRIYGGMILIQLGPKGSEALGASLKERPHLDVETLKMLGKKEGLVPNDLVNQLLVDLNAPQEERSALALAALKRVDTTGWHDAISAILRLMKRAYIEEKILVDLLKKSGPGGQDALPILIEMVTSKEKCHIACEILSEMKGHAAGALRPLMDTLLQDDGRAACVISALGEIGAPAEDALPLIRTFLDRGGIRFQAAKAVRQIEDALERERDGDIPLNFHL